MPIRRAGCAQRADAGMLTTTWPHLTTTGSECLSRLTERRGWADVGTQVRPILSEAQWLQRKMTKAGKASSAVDSINSRETQ